jgi:hypothetical protein
LDLSKYYKLSVKTGRNTTICVAAGII